MRAVAVLGVAALAFAAGPSDARVKRPALKPALVRVTSVAGGAAQIAQGTAFTVSVTVRNDSPKKASVALAAYLSRSSKPSGGVLKSALVRGRARVARRSRAKLKLSVTVPASEQVGKYTLVVCVRAKVGCKTGRKITVLVTIVTGTNPIKVAPQLDTAHAATQKIGNAGGAITATGADGSNYTLTIPSGALAGNEQITMTPISSLGGKPIGDVFGVQLAPDGLLLAKTATLDITPAKSIPLAKQVGWGYNGSGSDFHLVPLADQASLRIGVSHFSADGAGSATAAQKQAVTSRPPSTFQASYEQLRAELINQIRIAHQNGTAIDPSFIDKLQQFADAYYDQVIAPALGHAADGPTQLYDLFSKFDNWQRQLDLLGVTLEPRRSKAMPVLQAAFNKVLAQVVAQCGGGIHGLRFLVMVTAIARQGLLLGFVSEADASDAIQKCSHLKLRTVLDAGTGFNASCASNSCSMLDIQSDSSHLVVTDDLLTTPFTGLGDNVYAFGSSAAGSPATFPSFTGHPAPNFDISRCDASAKPVGTVMLIVVVVVDSEFFDPRVTSPTPYIVAGAYPVNSNPGAGAGFSNLNWPLKCTLKGNTSTYNEQLYDDAALAYVTAPDGIATHNALTNPPLPNVVLTPTGAADTYSGLFSGSGDITNWVGTSFCTGYCHSVRGTVSGSTITISPG